LTRKMLIAAVFAVVALVAPLGVATADDHDHGGERHGWGERHGSDEHHGWRGGPAWGEGHEWGGHRGWGHFGGGYGVYGVPAYTPAEVIPLSQVDQYVV